MSLSVEVNDCSYGEVSLERTFAEIVDLATEGVRLFEFTSNGETLSVKVRSPMLGKSVRVYVSVDSATSQGFNRYRDHRFNQIIDNLRALCAEKTLHGNLPEVFVSFIAMRSNLNEIDNFLELIRNVGVDCAVFRSLYLEDHLEERKTNHYGYSFDYDAECLTSEELALLGTYCEALGERHDIPVIIEWKDFEKNSGRQAGSGPICSEPWRTAYVLNRGLMPCCYGREPIVEWTDISIDSLEEGLICAMNSEPMRELRRSLASGRLGSYCDRTQGCPIVKGMRLTSGSAS